MFSGELDVCCSSATFATNVAVRYIRLTPQRREEFAAIIIGGDLSEFDGLELIQNNSTRWNSWFQSITRALQLQIIVASIEVKKRGGKSDAKLQMGTWHAAQWAYLRWEVLASLQRTSGVEEPAVLERLANENLWRLPFLIGIVTEGHSWAFTISTQHGLKTNHWEDHRFGTTENNLDVYKVVAGVRRIAPYAQEVYLLWFQKYILSGFKPDLM